MGEESSPQGSTSGGRWTSLLAGRRAIGLALLLAALGGALTLDLGLATDDHAHRAFVRAHLAAGEAGAPAAPGAPWEMFALGGRAGPTDIALRVFAGLLPWWSSPSLKAVFFRPLAAASHFLDGVLWPESPWLMHAHNALWYLGIVALVAVYLGRVLGSSLVAGLAAVLYAIDEAHVEGMAWIASRNTLMAAFFAAGTLVAHERARSGHRRGWAHLLAVLCLALGLLSGESAIAAWPYLLGHALFVDRGRPASRALGLLPLAVVTLGWHAFYRSQGYGAGGSGVYVDPATQPVAFLAVLPERMGIVLREELLVPAWMHDLAPPSARVALVVLGVALVLLALVPTWRLLVARAELRLLVFGMIGSALPICAISPAPRLLFLVGIGGSGLVAALVVAGLAAWRQRARAASVSAVANLALAAVLLLLHAVAAPLAARARAEVHVESDRLVSRAAASLPRVAPGTTLVVLDTDNYLLAQFALVQHAFGAQPPSPSAGHVLGSSTRPVRLTRRERSVLVLSLEGGYLREPWSHIVRDPRERFSPGQSVFLSIGIVTVEAVTHDGRPARVRVQLADAESPALVFLAWDRVRGRFVRVPLPPVGASVVLGGWPAATADPRGRT